MAALAGPAPTPTGLTPGDLDRLGLRQKRQLAEWTQTKTGERGFLPAAIRRMPLTARLDLSASPTLDAAWQVRERQRCAQDAAYLARSYGSVQPPKGPPIPFDLWPAQEDALHTFTVAEKIWVLKARRLGLSWLALHYALWVGGFDHASPGARILIICKNLPDASKLLDRVKAINARLPSYLHLPPGFDARTSLSLPERNAEVWALPATEGAGRLETATLVILDEFAFPKNNAASGIWTAVQPTIEGGGQIIGISTGNGRVGDGETFAEVWDRAVAGEGSIVPVFLPWSARPDRTVEWRERQRADFLSNEEFEAEYPDDPEQALAGQAQVKVYPSDGIAWAERLGGMLAETPEAAVMIEENGLELGTDWGDFQTFTVYATGLPGGGLFIFDEKVQSHVEPARASRALLLHPPAGMEGVRIVATRCDSAPSGTNSTFESVLFELEEELPRRFDLSNGSVMRISFSQYKEGGAQRGGVNTVAYLRMLLERSAEVGQAGWSGDPSDLHGCLVVHPRCKTWLAQARALERDSETGKVKKPTLDPKNLNKGDHGPDASIALAAPRAATWLATRNEEVEEHAQPT